MTVIDLSAERQRRLHELATARENAENLVSLAQQLGRGEAEVAFAFSGKFWSVEQGLAVAINRYFATRLKRSIGQALRRKYRGADASHTVQLISQMRSLAMSEFSVRLHDLVYGAHERHG